MIDRSNVNLLHSIRLILNQDNLVFSSARVRLCFRRGPVYHTNIHTPLHFSLALATVFIRQLIHLCVCVFVFCIRM